MKRTIRLFETKNKKKPFDDWLRTIQKKDLEASIRIQDRLHRIEQNGAFGDNKSVGKGVFELRFFFGPGYRVYYGEEDNTIVLLLCGGDKSTQQKDIHKAKEYWKEYLENKS